MTGCDASVRPSRRGTPGSSAFSGISSLRRGIRFRDQTPVPGYRRFGGDALQDWDAHERAYPDIRLLGRWREEPDALSVMKDLARLEPGEVALETGRISSGSARPGRLRILEKTPDRLRLEAMTPDATWLFVLKPSGPIVKCESTGARRRISRSSLAFPRFQFPGGFHRLERKEELLGAKVSLWGPITAVIIGDSYGFLEREGADVRPCPISKPGARPRDPFDRLSASWPAASLENREGSDSDGEGVASRRADPALAR